MKTGIIVLLLILGLSSGLVSDATCIDDISYYVIKHSDDVAVMLFYDHAPNTYLYDNFYSLFQDALTATEYEKNLKDKLHLLRVNINTGDLGNVQDIIETKTLPLCIVLDQGKKILEEKLTLETRENVMDYLSFYRTQLIKRNS